MGQNGTAFFRIKFLVNKILKEKNLNYILKINKIPLFYSFTVFFLNIDCFAIYDLNFCPSLPLTKKSGAIWDSADCG